MNPPNEPTEPTELPIGRPTSGVRRRPARLRPLLNLVLALSVVTALAACTQQAESAGAPAATAASASSPAADPTASVAATSPASPSSSPTTTPTPTPTATPSRPPEPNESLTKNTLYKIDLGKKKVTCTMPVRRPKPPLKNSKLAPYLRKVVGCLVKAFKGPLAAQGFPMSTPKIKTYAKTIKTPCGKFNQNGSPAYYCGTDHTIYWASTRDDGNEAYTFARLGYVGLAAHEFGHHIQSMTGMLSGYGEKYYKAKSSSARYLLSRRLELQAQCFEGVFLTMAKKSIDYGSNDRYQLKVWHSYTGDEDPPSSRKPDHGTSYEQVRWLYKGLDSGDFGTCNTWSASKKAVK